MTFHLIMLGNKAAAAVCQRVNRDLPGRRGRPIGPAWANRRLLLRDRERIWRAASQRTWGGCVDHDPSGQIPSASIAKEELPAFCAIAVGGGYHHDIRHRLWSFYRWCADADIPELTRRPRRSRPGGRRSSCSC